VNIRIEKQGKFESQSQGRVLIVFLDGIYGRPSYINGIRQRLLGELSLGPFNMDIICKDQTRFGNRH
jgi:hypothetical protein